MQHPIHRIVSFEFASGYMLRVRFDDGTEQVIDFEPILFGELYGPLRDRALFRRAQVDPEVHTLVCPTARTSIRRRCMTGPCTSGLFGKWLSVGSRCEREVRMHREVPEVTLLNFKPTLARTLGFSLPLHYCHGSVRSAVAQTAHSEPRR